MVVLPGYKLLEGVRVMAVNEEDARRVFLNQLSTILR